MLEVFKIVVLCLFCTLLISLISATLFRTSLFVTLLTLFYDFDKNTPIERHAINKIHNGYLKVRNIYRVIYEFFKETTKLFYVTNMNNVNKQNSDFDLSRFNRSGSVYSPISKIGNGSTSRRLQPSHTSTPLTRLPPWQRNSTSPVAKVNSLQNTSINRSPRYSLSATCNSTPSKNSSCDSQSIQTVAGPLLASTRFNINLGTYTDTKSPGLAGRVVQYHNEVQGNLTHQSKYGSPGQFPIVQLYKKELPIFTRSQRRCTVRIAPPDTLAYNTPEANAILRETFAQNKETTQEETEINTKSVLDALKEISRKRIHTDDTLTDISKRQRTGSVILNGAENVNKDGKRLREDTPPKPKDVAPSPTQNVPKKICVTDEIECSMSSSLLLRLQGQKRKAAVESMVNTNKQRRIGKDEQKSIEVQTQETIKPKENLKSTSMQTDSDPPVGLLDKIRKKLKDPSEKTIKEIDKERCTIQVEKPLKKRTGPVFDSKKLDIMRQNRLAMAIATLTGEKPKLISMPKLTIEEMKEEFLKEKAEREKEEELEKAEDEALERILEEAERQKQEEEMMRARGAKPNTSLEKSPEVKLQSILSPKNKAKHDKHVTFAIPTTEEEKTDNVPNGDATPAPIPATTENAPVAPSPAQLNASPNFNFGTSVPFSIPSPVPKSMPTFGAITSTTVSNNTISTPAVNDTVKPSTSIDFGAVKPIAEPVKAAPAPMTFGVASANATGLAFGSVDAVKRASPTPASTVTTMAVVSPITFGNKTPPAVPVMFGSPATTTSASNMFNFNAKPKAQPESPLMFGAKSPPKVGGFKFDLGKPATTTAAPAKPTFGDGQSKPFSFGPVTTADPGPVFGAAKTTQAFGGFGAVTTQAAVPFGAQPAPTTTQAPFPIATTAQNNAFGTIAATKTNTFTTPTTMFNAAQNVFSPSTTQSNIFGSTAPPGNVFGAQGGAFGAATPATTFGTTQNAFGAATQSNAFGTATTTAPSAFGTATTQSGAFGTAAPAFGPITSQSTTFGTPTSTQASSTFGSYNAPTTSQNVFGGFGAAAKAATTTAAPFAFGATTAKPFAFNSTTTTAASNVFGGASFAGGFGAPTTTTTAGGSGIFGAATTAFGTTGTTTTAVFGTSTTTTTASGFGQQGAGIFGPGGGFGTTTSGSVFGAGQSGGFGATPAQSSFGGATGQPFGTQPGFGASTATTTNNNQTGGFGSTFGTSGSFGGFGATTTTTQPSGFGTSTTNVFGTNASQAQGFGGFGTPTTQPVFAFGSNSAATATPPTTNPFPFGTAAAPKPAGFNFSASATTPQLNFTGPAPPFGAAPPPGFGTPPNTGMFSIGSGSTAPKQRPMMKARRRNN